MFTGDFQKALVSFRSPLTCVQSDLVVAVKLLDKEGGSSCSAFHVTMILELLLDFYNNSGGQKPEQIMIFRDGSVCKELDFKVEAKVYSDYCTGKSSHGALLERIS
ncbi:hypothetical protein C5167_030857 [Papaver somniferum]|nr:hypothetical protein C5167_030857 [Papaver somniferum]